MKEQRASVYIVFILTLTALMGCVVTNRSPATTPSPAPEEEVPIEQEFVVVEWAGSTTLYVAQVVERREGLVGVLYPDGSREWAEPERVRPLTLYEGDTVRIRWRESGPEWSGRVVGLRSDLVQVHFERGTTTWVSLDMLARVQSTAEPTNRSNPTTQSTRSSQNPRRSTLATSSL